MPGYSRDWDTVVLVTPLGSADPSTLETAIQNKMVDLDERLSDVLVDPSADPCVAAGGLATGVIKYISAMGFQPSNDEDDVTWTGVYVQSDNTTPNDLIMPLPVESLWEITAVNVLADKHDCASIDVALHRTTYGASPADSTLGSVNLAATGINDIALFSGTEATAGRYYWLSVSSVASDRFRIYAVKLVYDEVAA